MNGFLVPANAKRGTLIFNIFRPFDLIMFGTGMAVTLLLLVLVDSNNTIMILLSCLPVGVTGLLVIPIPNYHNVRTLIGEVYNYYFVNRRKYIWRGWCYTYEQSDESDK